MDRSDEKREHQEGNVLDIGTPRTTDHIASTETDEQRRRRRMERGADEAMTTAQEEEPVHRGPGVTGADMGIGGEGTDIEPTEP
jgi:hypothetical protein